MGILQNASSEGQPEFSSARFDRSKVLENTRLNSKLGLEGQQVRAQFGSQSSLGKTPRKYPKTKAPTSLIVHEDDDDGEDDEDKKDARQDGKHDLQWDEVGIKEHDLERGQTEKITEPNTPYMGTAESTEYYDEDEVPPALDLGESVAK